MTETTDGPVWMKALGGMLVLSFGGMVALTVLLASAIGPGPAVLTMLPAVLVLAVGLLLLTASIRTTVADHVEIRLSPIWRRRLEYAQIASARVEERSWFRFGGVGLRRRPGATGLLLGNRLALVIRTQEGHEYVVQCGDPERVMERIRDQLSSE
jgi:hypothetical protein